MAIGDSAATWPPNYRWQAVLFTVLLLWPFGPAALVTSIQVDRRLQVGDTEGALEASRNTRGWCRASLAAVPVFLLVLLVAFGSV